MSSKTVFLVMFKKNVDWEVDQSVPVKAFEDNLVANKFVAEQNAILHSAVEKFEKYRANSSIGDSLKDEMSTWTADEQKMFAREDYESMVYPLEFYKLEIPYIQQTI